jgi:hypothetical protein
MKRIRGFLLAKTAGFLHKNQLARSFAIGAAEAPQFFMLAFYSVYNYI